MHAIKVELCIKVGGEQLDTQVRVSCPPFDPSMRECTQPTGPAGTTLLGGSPAELHKMEAA